MTTVAQALAAARALGVTRLDARLLLAELLGQRPSWLAAHGEAALDLAAARDFGAGCRRLTSGEPLAYVLGHWSFRGLRLAISPAVLVPRPETELLVEWALERLAADRPAPGLPRVIDLGTGSGAIAISLALECPQARVWASDRSEAALAVARANAEALGAKVTFLQGDWWQATPGLAFELAVANPPYVADGDPHLQALAYEPAGALRAGADGLADLRRIVAGARTHLAPGGWLLLEHGHDQGAAVRRLLQEQGWGNLQTRPDLAGLDRCSAGRRG